MPTATVHAWNDTGWRHDGAHARLIAFDLDNTLAVSKQPMKPDMTVRIEALTELMPVAIVTGGGRELVISQVLDVLGPRADLSNLHVMPAGGSSYYRWREGAWRLEYERTLSARDRDAAILSLTRRARELGMWPEHPWGESIEDRGSQITFSALGQLAPIEEKRRWDPDDTKKRRRGGGRPRSSARTRGRLHECRCERRKHRQGVRPARIGGTARHRHR